MDSMPFAFGRTASEAHFTDRDEERARLRRNFGSGVNTIIVSPRRWGKSSLVARVAQEVTASEHDIKVCLIDAFNVRDEAGFYAQLVRGVLQATSTKWEEWVQVAKQFLGHLRPTISVGDAIASSITFDLDWEQAQQTPDEILDLAENIAAERDIRLVVCVDEFQAIADFKESLAFQRKLRSHWQAHQHVCYCLYGSKRHMLIDIFTDPSMPFYRFGDVMTLGKIGNTDWGDFIVDRFAATGKTIPVQVARDLAALVDNHSYYVQQLALQAWFRTKKACTPAIVDAAISELADQLGLGFVSLAGSLSAKQLSFLHAVMDGETELSSQLVLTRYRLGTSANVVRMRQTLAAKEIIDVTPSGVEILDPMFAFWLRRDCFGR